MIVSEHKIRNTIDSLKNINDISDEMIIKHHGILLWESANQKTIKFNENLYGFPLAKNLGWFFRIDFKSMFYNCIMESNVPDDHKQYIRILKKLQDEANYDNDRPLMLLLIKMIYLYVPYMCSLNHDCNVYEILSKTFNKINDVLSYDTDGTVHFTEESFAKFIDHKFLIDFVNKHRLNHMEVTIKSDYSEPISKMIYTYNMNTCNWEYQRYDKNQINTK